MLCDLWQLRVMCRLVLGRLLRFGVGGCGVRTSGHSVMRLMRFSRMRAMAYHRFMSFGEKAEEKQR